MPAVNNTTKRIPGIKVEVPIWSYNWESYRSQVNTISRFLLPAPRLCEKLSLEVRMHNIELFDETGKQATIYRSDSYGTGIKNLELLYIREDLAKTYLNLTKQSMLWTIWGERGINYDNLLDIQKEDHYRKVKQDGNHIYKKLITEHDLN